MDVTVYADIEPFRTKDGSEIREWAGAVSAPARNQSLAEATVPPGGATAEHYHRLTEELYLITAGRGRLRVGDLERDLAVGDCAVIPPGAPHKIWNTGEEPLRIVCACAPAYAHDDTVLLEDAGLLEFPGERPSLSPRGDTSGRSRRETPGRG